MKQFLFLYLFLSSPMSSQAAFLKETKPKIEGKIRTFLFYFSGYITQTTVIPANVLHSARYSASVSFSLLPPELVPRQVNYKEIFRATADIFSLSPAYSLLSLTSKKREEKASVNDNGNMKHQCTLAFYSFIHL